MAIRKNIALASPIIRNAFENVTGFALDYLYIHDDYITVFLLPSGGPTINIYPSDAVGVVAGKGTIILTPQQSLKIAAFIQAIEDACKANLELPQA